MSLEVEIKVLSDDATPAVEQLNARANPAALTTVVGRRCASVTKAWIRTLPPNRRNWPTTRFWERSADSVDFITTETAAIVRVKQLGFRQRYFGGTIKPFLKQYLAIPISPTSYGHRTSEFPGLFLLKTPKGAFLVQHGLSSDAKGELKRGGRKLGGHANRRLAAALNFLFVLKKSVEQDGDPNIIPADEVYTTTAVEAIKERLALS